jgi:hypothetical protein
MTQDQETGVEAARFGHEAAALIGEKIGAKRLTRNSNEFEGNGQRVTIRTARQGNNQVGVLYDLLKRVQSVVGAFEIALNEFELYSLSPDEFRKAMRDSPTGKGSVGLVIKRDFMDAGRLIRSVKINAR